MGYAVKTVIDDIRRDLLKCGWCGESHNDILGGIDGPICEQCGNKEWLEFYTFTHCKYFYPNMVRDSDKTHKEQQAKFKQKRIDDAIEKYGYLAPMYL